MFKMYRNASDNMKEIFDIGFFTGLLTYLFVQIFSREYLFGIFIVPLSVFIVLYLPVLLKTKERTILGYIIKTTMYLIGSLIVYSISQSLFTYSYETGAFESIFFFFFTIFLIGFLIGMGFKIAWFLLDKLPEPFRLIKIIPVLVLILFCAFSWLMTISGIVGFFIPVESDGFEQLGSIFVFFISLFFALTSTIGVGFYFQKYNIIRRKNKVHSTTE